MSDPTIYPKPPEIPQEILDTLKAMEDRINALCDLEDIFKKPKLGERTAHAVDQLTEQRYRKGW